MTIFPGRYTASNDRELVVFLIGMRFNGWRGLGNALRIFMEMPKMLAELQRDPALGLLESRIALEWPVISITQYWNSFEQLERYAAAANNEHLPAWKRFNKLGRAAKGAGIWHETYRVPAGSYEAIYANMPRFGLAKALDHHPIGAGEQRARQRMREETANEATATASARDTEEAPLQPASAD
jgi:hypothetical protein